MAHIAVRQVIGDRGQPIHRDARFVGPPIRQHQAKLPQGKRGMAPWASITEYSMDELCTKLLAGGDGFGGAFFFRSLVRVGFPPGTFESSSPPFCKEDI